MNLTPLPYLATGEPVPPRRQVAARGARLSLIAAATICGLAIGCTGVGRRRIETPTVDIPAAAAAALQEYDSDGNGTLGDAELVACPAINRFRDAYDSNGDGVTLDELETRFALLFGSNAPGMMKVACTVANGGRPVANALVRFTPERFLTGAVLPASGTTDANGRAEIAIDDAALPESDRGLAAMQVGLYRVEVQHPTGENKTLGWEVSNLTRVGASPQFDLSR